MISEMVILACENGHISNWRYLQNVTDALDNDEDPFETSPNYCTECGGQNIFLCQNCGRFFTDTLALQESIEVAREDLSLSDYCPNCGQAQPWVETVEAAEVREGEFLEIDSSDISGFFYQELVNEINQCYRVQANEATYILYRKLLESLIYDVLSNYCNPAEEIDLYYDTERGRKHQFSTLLESLKEKSGELHKFSDPIDDHQFHEQVADFKENGDASAHSKENLVTNDDVEESSKEATHIAKVLFDLRRRVAAGVTQQPE